ncbi:uncharacterized protein LOC128952418 [Oppia nitens]|uniref:uncharacterized protein LOC128952418 n=1 Tax=Oppia nitens TaxID=1686743 RepID=UPI0023D9D18B|nr:uncharacterized protein LOC128952418 [Oppia nitens]
MRSILAIFAIATVASAFPSSHGPIAITTLLGHTQQSSYRLKTDHPVQEPAPIIKGVAQPYAVPVPQPYAVPRAVTVEVPRAVPYTVTRTVGVPVIARGEPIVRTRIVQSESLDSGLGNGGLLLSGNNGGYGGDNGLSLGLSHGLGGLELGGHGY